MKKLSVLLILVLALSIFAAGCSDGSNRDYLNMGFVPMMDADALVENVEPLAEMLSDELGMEVRAFTATRYVGVVEALGSQQVDFGFIPPMAYILANQQSDAEVILTALNQHGEAFYRSQFIVREDSDIQDFEDIKEKTVAFVDPSSTSGHIFPHAHLKDFGLEGDQDFSYHFAGGHDSALQLLLNGDVDVATTFVDARERYAEDFPTALDETRVLGYTQDIPNISVTVGSHLDSEMQEKIQQALLNISEDPEGKKLLIDLFNQHGYVEADDKDYDVIRTTAKLMDIDLEAQ
ncbi:phosphate/phosphite/phosphonate ABC transporter substrate-binding protein [Proteinivorax hydrogeniformans]|uniref:Phosphate/phosphite/phosphonate ABC transporter substrate-binding protein n=1 Tax=Proteinivorax hydrogeniformans TaxID=1826727 RepID=A0AAU8HSV9_9FIRM